MRNCNPRLECDSMITLIIKQAKFSEREDFGIMQNIEIIVWVSGFAKSRGGGNNGDFS